MARIHVTSTQVKVSLSASERGVLARPGIFIERNRIKSANLRDKPSLQSLGSRISRRSLLGSVTGLFQKGQKKIVMLSEPFSKKGSFLVILVNHPTLDEVWVRTKNAQELLNQLTKQEFSKK